MFYPAGLLLLISLYQSWRLSKTTVDPDWAYFNLWGFTGSVYGRDFIDCKTPAIHLWYLGLSKLVGRDVQKVKFTHHFLLGAVGVVVYLLSGNFWYALTYTVLINSGVFLSFHGNVSQHPAAFIALAFAINHPVYSPLFWLLALAFEPKLILSFAVLYWKWTVGLGVLGIVVYLLFQKQTWFQYVWESSVVIPVRIGKTRKGKYDWMPWFTANGISYIIPMLVLSFYYGGFNPVPVALYLLLLWVGRAVRQNHLIPLIAWVSLPPFFAIAVVVIDFIVNGFYLGDMWDRFYGALKEPNDEAQKAGEFIKDLSGSLYVNGIHSGIYIHAQKPVSLGFAEQIEIRENAHERRKLMIERWKETPPDTVVTGLAQGINFKPVGYTGIEKFGDNWIYRKTSLTETGLPRTMSRRNNDI